MPPFDDFLLTFHSNHGPISYRFRDRQRFRSKIENFPTHVFNAPSLVEFPWNLSRRWWLRKLMPIPEGRISLTICSFIQTQYQRSTAGRTDEQRELVKQYRAQHAIHVYGACWRTIEIRLDRPLWDGWLHQVDPMLVSSSETRRVRDLAVITDTEWWSADQHPSLALTTWSIYTT